MLHYIHVSCTVDVGQFLCNVFIVPLCMQCTFLLIDVGCRAYYIAPCGKVISNQNR